MSQPYAIEHFRGLSASVDPSEVGADSAIDVLNIDFSDPGLLKPRPGYQAWSTATMPVSPNGLVFPFPLSVYSPTLLAVSGYVNGSTTTVTLAKADSSGNVSSVGTWTSLGALDYAVYGTPTKTYAFISSITQQLRSYDGTTLTTAPGYPRYLGVTPNDNRLAQANFATASYAPGGIAGSPSTVSFSNPGDPLTYGANNYVQLTPGDGEQIQGIATWQDYLLVFKRTKMFVFYGQSTDGAGDPVFNYRTISLGPGAAYTQFANFGLKGAVGPDGFYYFGTDGIYKTTGGAPVKVTAAIDDISLLQNTPASHTTWFQPGTSSAILSSPALTFVGKMMFTATGLALNTQTGDWSYWNLGGAPFSFYATSGGSIVLFANANDSKVYTLSSGVTTDNGTAITSRYRSGFFAPAGPGTQATIRETDLFGTGAVTLTWSRDLQTALTSSSAQAVTMAQGKGVHRAAAVGALMSYQIDATGPFTLNRMTAFVRDAKTT